MLRRRRHHLLQRFDAAAVQPVPAAYVRAYDVRVGSHEERSEPKRALEEPANLDPMRKDRR